MKSLRAGQIQLKESYVAVRDGEAWLFNAHISPYAYGNRDNHDPVRTRKLLLHRREIERLEEADDVEGHDARRHARLPQGRARQV